MNKLVVLTALAALALPAIAAAKGPGGATITGPGLDQPLSIKGDGEMGQGTSLGTLTFAGGFFAQMYPQTPDPRLRSRPKGPFGPRYTVVYTVPGGEGIG